MLALCPKRLLELYQYVVISVKVTVYYILCMPVLTIFFFYENAFKKKISLSNHAPIITMYLVFFLTSVGLETIKKKIPVLAFGFFGLANKFRKWKKNEIANVRRTLDDARRRTGAICNRSDSSDQKSIL